MIEKWFSDGFSYLPPLFVKLYWNVLFFTQPPVLIHSDNVSRGVESQLLPDHREAGGGGAGVSDGGGAHLQPLLRATGEVCRLLRGREPGVSSNPHHKRHHGGERVAWLDVTALGKCWWSITEHAVIASIPQLLKIRPSEPGQEYVEMTFVEHQTCECR